MNKEGGMGQAWVNQWKKKLQDQDHDDSLLSDDDQDGNDWFNETQAKAKEKEKKGRFLSKLIFGSLSGSGICPKRLELGGGRGYHNLSNKNSF